MNPIEGLEFWLIVGPCVDIQELRMKFHPSCWRCSKCNDILDGVYYSYKGRQYCERDVEGVYEGKRPEKRHTFMGQQGVGARPPMPRPPMPMGRPIQGGGRPFQGGGRPIQGGGRPGISNGRM